MDMEEQESRKEKKERTWEYPDFKDPQVKSEAWVKVYDILFAHYPGDKDMFEIWLAQPNQALFDGQTPAMAWYSHPKKVYKYAMKFIK